MYFQVNFSPNVQDGNGKKKEIEEEIIVLSLAPFTPIPKIFFEDVLVNKEATQKICIKNPTKNNLEILLVQVPPEDRFVYFNWAENVVPGKGEVILEIKWIPKQEGAWRDTLIIDGKNTVIKKSIPIAFKSKAPKRIFKKGSNKVVPLRRVVSPSKSSKRKVSPVKKVVMFKSPKTSQLRNYVATNNKKSDEENLSPANKKFYSPSRMPLQANLPIPTITVNDEIRRETYNVNNKENFKTFLSENFEKNTLLNTSINFDDSLELKSPESPHRCESSNYTPLLPDDKLLRTNRTRQESVSTPVRIYNFSPTISSTVTKSDSTFDKNDTAETYIKLNASSETYLLGNISGDTYIKANLSGDTYVKDNSIGNLASLHDVCLTNKKLSNISEELSVQLNSSRIRKRKSDTSYEISPNKRQSLNKSKTNGWSQKPLSKMKFSNGLNLRQFIEKTTLKEKAVVLHDPDSFLNQAPNPYLLTCTNDIDPFMSATFFYDPRWIDEQENRFMKLLNALLTPPDELNVNSERHPVDVAKLWQECKKLDVSKAPTNEEVSCKHVGKRLNQLREVSIKLFRSEEIYVVLSKCVMMVENNKLVIRKDRDVHLDLGLQYEIMSLFLSYNPLWLRLGLETIFGVTIPLRSNTDIIGLSTFIMKHFFKDSYLLKKYKNVYSEKYSLEIKKHVLKKFFMFVFFMDKAKLKKIIPYDPCLFCKNAPFKESKEVLTRFTREVISAIGDVSKFLRQFGYELFYKQLYIHEFEYAIENLGTDLRDGIRLTRIMEIILLQDNLTSLLRVPTVSRLQKIYNLKIVFDSLAKAGFKIIHEIIPKDIVDGHREKTLSFLWQVIYKFQGPRFTKAVITVQTWWQSLPIIIKRRSLNRERSRKLAACIKIQKWIRRLKLAKQFEYFANSLKIYLLNLKLNRAALIIQAKFRMYIQKRNYLNTYHSIIILQRYIRKWLVRRNFHQKITAATKIQATYRSFQCRKQFLLIKTAVVKIEEKYTATKTMRKQLQFYEKLKASTLYIQRRFRANLLMRKARYDYLDQREKIIFIQRKFKANILMKQSRLQYLALKETAIYIERNYYACKIRRNFLKLKQTTIILQNKFRANQLMQIERNKFLIMRNACIVIQRKFRSFVLMKVIQQEFLILKKLIVSIQNRFRANKLMRKQRNSFNELKLNVIKMQRKFIANRLMQAERNRYEHTRNMIIFIQRKFRLKRAATMEKLKYLHKRTIVINMQQIIRTKIVLRKLSIKDRIQYIETIYYRNGFNNSPSRFTSYLLLNLDRNKFLLKLHAAKTIQNQFRAQKAMLQEKNYYNRLKQTTITLQRKYRAKISMRKTHNEYVLMKKAAIIIQQKFRATLSMRIENAAFIKLKMAVKTVENQYVALKLMRESRSYYIKLKRSVLIIEEQYQAKLLSRDARLSYKLYKKSVIIIQNKFRANLAMKKEKMKYDELKLATIAIQNRYRANKLMERDRRNFIEIKNAAVTIQQKFRATLSMRLEKAAFIKLKMAVKIVENRYEALKLMRESRSYYIKLKRSVRIIEEQYQAKILTRDASLTYNFYKKFVIIIQNKFRANLAMKIEKTKYNELKLATIAIQNRYRANKLMQKDRRNFIQIKNAAITIQIYFRAYRLMTIEKHQYRSLLNATILIQRRFKSNRLMQTENRYYLKLKQTTIFVQRKFIANQLMRTVSNYYGNLRRCAIYIQRRYRELKVVQKLRIEFIALQNASIVIQRRFRANLLMIVQRQKFLDVKNAAITIQRKYRSITLMRLERKSFKIKMSVVLKLQTYIRGYLARVEYNKLMDPALVAQRKEQKLRRNSATKIQAFWRGYHTRKSNEPKEMEKIRNRIIVAAKNNKPQNTLAHRKDQALKVFQNETSSVSQIIQALMDIEYVTRRHKSTCLNMAEQLAKHIVLIILAPGRSLPNIEACIIAVSCLINFAKYRPSLKHAWFPEHLEGILSTMKIFSDKESILFPNLCTLLWVYAHTDEYRNIIIGIPNLQQKFCKMYDMCERKQKMCDRGGCKSQASAFKMRTKLPMPLLVPDWGLEYKNKPRTFTNSIHGLKSLMIKLNIK